MNTGSGADLPVELEAVRLAIEWKHLFATELRLAAQRLAVGAKVVSADQYRRALATALERVLENANSPRVEPADVYRRIA
jgi:Fe2+ or Zn2+ uptake regulation protein